MSIHVISYLPRGPRSSTKRLLDTFLGALGSSHSVDHLDLVNDMPDLFTAPRLDAYLRRSYAGETLTGDDQALMAGMDTLAERARAAQTLVLATPMHNFSTPAPVKAWFDAVMLKGYTWDLGSEGFRGLLTGRRAIILATSGGIYEGEMAAFEHLVSYCRNAFAFMGCDPVIDVFAQGMNMLGDDDREAALASASAKAVSAAQAVAVES